ncbi:MAG: tetratricopeptide repeat protein [Opitutales bacterium]
MLRLLKSPPGIVLAVLVVLGALGGIGWLLLKPYYDESQYFRMLDQAKASAEVAVQSLERFEETAERLQGEVRAMEGETPELTKARDDLLANYRKAIGNFDETIRRFPREEVVAAAVQFTEDIGFVEGLPGLERANRINYLEQLVELRPDDPAPKAQLVLAYGERVGDLRRHGVPAAAVEEVYQTAQPLLKAYRDACAARPEYFLGIAELELNSGRSNVSAVESALSQAHALSPSDPTLDLRLAGALLSTGERAKAERAVTLLEPLRDHPELGRRASIVLIEHHAAEGRSERVLEIGEAVVADPQASLGEKIFVLITFERVNREGFLRLLPRLQEEVRANPADVAELTRPLLERNYAWLLEDWLRGLNRSHRTSLPFQFVFAGMLLDLKEWEDLQAYIENTDWGRFEFRRLGLLARVNRELGKPGRASALWEQAVEAAGDSRERLDSLRRQAERWSWPAEARQAARQSYYLDPRQSVLGETLVQAYLLEGETEEAVGVLEQMREQDSTNPKLLNDLAYLYLLTGGDRASALNFASRSVETKPENLDYRVTEAFALFQNGQVDRAIERLARMEDADKADPRAPGRRAVLGFILAKAGLYEEADRVLPESLMGLLLLPEEKRLIIEGRKIVSEGLGQASAGSNRR